MAYSFGGSDFGGALPLSEVDDLEKQRVSQIARGQPAKRPAKRPPQELSEAQEFGLHHFTTEIERCRTYLYSYHRQWYINIAALLGSRGVQAESIARITRVKIQQPEHRINHQSNLIGGNVRRLVGYLARSNPDIQVIPADADDPMQLDAAAGARRWLDFYDTYDDYRSKELEALYWAATTGLGLTYACFDPTGGPREAAIDDVTGQPLQFQDGSPMVRAGGRPMTFSTGMAHTVVIPTFHYVFGVSARNDEELNWNGTQSWWSFRYLESFMPGAVRRFGLVPEPQFSTAQSMYERQVMQTLGPTAGNAGAAAESNEPGCVVNLIWIAPYYLPRERFGDDFYEQGAVMMFAQGRLLDFKPNEYMELAGVNPRRDWNPITRWNCHFVPGRMIGQGVPDNLIPVLDGINFIISRVRESQRMTGQPKVLKPKNTTQQKINNEAGQEITYNPAIGKPEFLAPPPMPAYIFNVLELLESHLERVSSQPPMLQGRAQGQVRSGLGVQLLQEQALTEFTPLIEHLDHCRARHKRQLLLREIQFSDSARRIPRRLQSGEWTQDVFFARAMNPDFTIRMTPGTSIPQSKALVMSEIDRMIAWGVLQPAMIPQHAQVIARAMKYEIPQYTPDDQEQAMNHARHENALLRSGLIEQVFSLPSFNHPVHINEHLRDLHSPRVQEQIAKERAATGQSETLNAYYKHVGEHMGFMQAQAMGVVIPQPQIPFEDLQLAQGGGQPGGGTPIQGQVGAQGMTNRGGAAFGDQRANEAQHSAVGPRATTVEPGGDESGGPSFHGETGGA